jgi:hypothetical protein
MISLPAFVFYFPWTILAYVIFVGINFAALLLVVSPSSGLPMFLHSFLLAGGRGLACGVFFLIPCFDFPWPFALLLPFWFVDDSALLIACFTGIHGYQMAFLIAPNFSCLLLSQ